MRPTVRYTGSADQLLANLFSLSIVTSPPKVFAKVNSAQFSRFLSGDFELHVRDRRCKEKGQLNAT